MAQMEDRLRALESRKRQRPTEDSDDDEYLGRQQHDQTGESPTNHQRTLSRHSTIQPSIELEDSESSSSGTLTHRRKRQRYRRGIKVTPSYTLKTSSSLREWGDWKRDIERVFEGDPDMYRKGAQKILKALDYLEPSLKSLWYTYSEQKKGIR